MSWLRTVLAVGALLMVGGSAATARAQPAPNPTITLEATELRVGQKVVVTLSGWTIRNVTLAFCGNLAKRGTADCNMPASQAMKLVNSTEITELLVSAPPTTCPCVIRGRSASQEEIAVAPVVLVDVPVGPVVGPVFGSLLSIALDVRAAHRGVVAALRSTFGGPATYLVTVSVRNVTTETLTDIVIAGSAGRGPNDEDVSFDVPPPGALAAGQTWAHDAYVTLPAPVFRNFFWRVTASGAGEPVDGAAVTHRVPIGFILAVAIFAADVVAIVCRRSTRRRAQRREESRRAAEETLPRVDASGPATIFDGAIGVVEAASG